VDAAATGQVVSHLRGPRTIQEIVQVGLIRNQTAWVQEILEDPARTGLVIVALPEEMPVAETAEVIEQLPESVGTPVLGIVANRVVVSRTDEAAIDALRDARPDALVLEAARLWADLASSQRPDLERLRTLGPPVAEVPLVGAERHGLELTRRIAAALAGAAS
jgi:anion-transporting  ArsA/GET3 family ATPase